MKKKAVGFMLPEEIRPKLEALQKYHSASRAEVIAFAIGDYGQYLKANPPKNFVNRVSPGVALKRALDEKCSAAGYKSLKEFADWHDIDIKIVNSFIHTYKPNRTIHKPVLTRLYKALQQKFDFDEIVKNIDFSAMKPADIIAESRAERWEFNNRVTMDEFCIKALEYVKTLFKCSNTKVAIFAINFAFDAIVGKVPEYNVAPVKDLSLYMEVKAEIEKHFSSINEFVKTCSIKKYPYDYNVDNIRNLCLRLQDGATITGWGFTRRDDQNIGKAPNKTRSSVIADDIAMRCSVNIEDMALDWRMRNGLLDDQLK